MFKKLLKIVGVVVIWFVFSAVFSTPISMVVYTAVGNEAPVLASAVVFFLSALITLYCFYFSDLKNAKKRGEYLLKSGRKFPGFRKDALDIIKDPSYRVYIIFFISVLTLFFLILARKYIIQHDYAFIAIVSGVLSALIMDLLGTACFAILLVIYNIALHLQWTNSLKVPKDSEEEMWAKRRKHTFIFLYSVQFAMSAIFYILYLIEPYYMIAPAVITPALFLQMHIYTVVGIVARRDAALPIKKYVILLESALVLYLVSLFFGVFAI